LRPFFAQKTAKCGVSNKSLSSFPLFFIFFAFSCHLRSSAGRSRISFPRLLPALPILHRDRLAYSQPLVKRKSGGFPHFLSVPRDPPDSGLYCECRTGFRVFRTNLRGEVCLLRTNFQYEYLTNFESIRRIEAQKMRKVLTRSLRGLACGPSTGGLLPSSVGSLLPTTSQANSSRKSGPARRDHTPKTLPPAGILM